jgi:hypothetical protein
MRRNTRNQQTQSGRRGAAMVEFAIIAPIFLALILGTVELGTALKTSNTLASAIRGGGRLASMDWEGIVPDGVTTNEKVLTDIENFLAASGIPVAETTLTITSAEGEDEGEPFDLADPDNRLRLFRITAEVPYSAISLYPSHFMSGHDVKASIVFRAGRVQMMMPE